MARTHDDPGSIPPDRLVSAAHAGGTMISLVFADGRAGLIDLKALGVDTARLKLASARESWGSAIEFDTIDGGTMHVDSAVSRACIDPAFASELQRDINKAMETP